MNQLATSIDADGSAIGAIAVDASTGAVSAGLPGTRAAAACVAAAAAAKTANNAAAKRLQEISAGITANVRSFVGQENVNTTSVNDAGKALPR